MEGLRGHDVLLLSFEDGERQTTSALLRAAGASLHLGPWDEDTADLVFSTPFDAIVVRFPVTGTRLSDVLRAVRAPGSGCRHAGVVLVADPSHARDANAYVGRGVNRVIQSDDLERRLAHVLTELLDVAPRLRVRAPTRVTIHSDGRALMAFCQTENLSRSGMLLKGFGHHAVGTTLDFELNIPGDAAPIRGSAEVRRATNVVAERVEGIGARFLSFATGDRFRLESFLSRAAV